MSRIGRMPITVPAGTDVKVEDGNLITVKGPKGTLTQKLHSRMTIKQDKNIITVERPTEEAEDKALHGLTRTLLNNMIVGVNSGFQKQLEIVGVGYRAVKSGKTLTLSLGFSHPVVFEEDGNVTFDVPNPNSIIVKGASKQDVGQIAAQIRAKRPPEPYHGKGVKYVDEHIRRKAGKTGK